ncbi:hypothetical protein PTSG_03267 [Salpingoeca rosetta]|uniref:Ran guanine nucleotide release factor n=1 Tax=Salpingoeca rosetta (strain ATCC 50818 / BSB-021) TaxID=946362 RepID=F2U4P5_SALR5|nr:uncharacterized protein PTSG_03267 [Salpingoeca rosetta]EGD82611.1 hypothetical protein PTSG_03267 [Salpingoeca rosetta]|eukprot:XP_004995847.1 hypothetical protein PTSG_03267 [Salpingoeca rosetta]
MGDEPVVRPLFGGAMSMTVPARFMDISMVRQVPNNQEVFADASTDQSFIIEILELPPDAPDAEAARFHFDVIASEGGALSTEVETETQQRVVMGDNNVQRTVMWGLQQVGKHRDRADRANSVRVHVACFRAHNVSADIVVSFNSPVFISEQSAVAPNVDAQRMAHYNAPEQALAVFTQAIDTLQINDWSLFG